VDVKRWLRANWDRAAAWFCVVLGVVFLFIGWEGVSKSAYPAEQLPFILSGGIGGALMVALGATLLISADLRDEWQKLDRIEKKLDQVTLSAPSSNGNHAPSEKTDKADKAEKAEKADGLEKTGNTEKTETVPRSEALQEDHATESNTEELATDEPARRTRRRPLTAQRDDH
jgi:hypothetical protein